MNKKHLNLLVFREKAEKFSLKIYNKFLYLFEEAHPNQPKSCIGLPVSCGQGQKNKCSEKRVQSSTAKILVKP